MCYAGEMPRFEAFPGLRYDDDAAPLSDVVAPPYDVVDEQYREKLAARSPYNAIHIELPTDDTPHDQSRYAHAAALLERWEREGALRRDDVPSLYVYRMRFRAEDGRELSSTGVIGALGLDTAGGSEVLPHERTMPRPKGDRLDLLRACRANLSPIWALSLADGLAKACIRAIGDAAAPMSATDDEGIVHELWPVVDTGAIATITGLVATTPVVIADGHHRYETATFYRAERRGANGDQPGDYDLVMALIVELSEDELSIRPIHRLVSGLPEGFDFVGALSGLVEVQEGPADTTALVAAMAEVGALGLVSPAGNYLLVPRPELDDAAEADLDSSRLDAALAGLPAHEVTYQHGAGLAARAVERGSAQAAFLLRPATVQQIAETASSGRRMPPKTTFFHPKPRTGMVFRTIAG